MLRFKDPDNGNLVDARSAPWKPQRSEPFVLAGTAPGFSHDQIDQREFSLWRYRPFLQTDVSETTWRRATMGEGATSLVDVPSISMGLKLKMDFAMPTLSFKDRGVAVMMAQAAEWGVEKVVIDSSGNAATSVSAYAARLGMHAVVFVPGAVSDGKLKQIASHGAEIHKIDGSREDTAAATHEYLDRHESFYASHVYNPVFHQGTKTMIFEIWEQMGGAMPDAMILPVGNGTMLIGALIGLGEMKSAGIIPRIPKIVAVQSEACAPISRAFDTGSDLVTPVKSTNTIAEGIAIAAPARGREILDRLRAVNGQIVTVDDKTVVSAQHTLAANGFFVEPTAAASFAAYRKYTIHGTCVVPLCGAGLKSVK